MRSINRVQLLGYTGSDTETRITQGGVKVATLSLATSSRWKDGAGKEHERTEWHRVQLWDGKNGGGLATLAEKYVRKGDPLLIDGRIRYDKWVDRDGVERFTTEITAEEMTLLKAKGDR